MKTNKVATILITLLILLALATPVYGASSTSTQTGVSDKHTVNGFKFNDINGNGIREPGEPGIPNVVVELFNSTNILVAQTTTNQTGFYEFRHLGVGSYTVQEIVPTGYLNTTPTSLAVAIAPKTSIVNVNFGNAQPATIEGLKYNDLNKNGLFDLGEQGLPGWTINLANTSGPVGTTVTGAIGAFQFNNLRPGQYTISEVLQSGFTNTSPLSMMVTVTSGQVLNVTTSFGLFGNIPAVKFAYVTNAGSNSVSVIDTSTNTVVGSPIPVGNAPVDVAITPDGTRAYVTNQASASVSVIDTSTNTVVGSPIPVGGAPFGVAITPDGTRAYVTNIGSNSVSVIGTSTNTVVGSPIPVGSLPIGVAITPDGTRAYVTNAGSNSVSVIDTSTNTVVGSPIPVRTFPRGVAITPDGTRVYVTNQASASVSVIDTSTNTVVGSPIPVGSNPDGMAITPDGTRAYVTNAGSASVSVIDTSTNTVVGSPIPVGSIPYGVAITPDGTRVYVTNQGSKSVSVIDTSTNTVVGSPIPVGNAPFGLAITP